MQNGVVNTSRILAESNSGKTVAKKIQAQTARWQEQLSLAEQRLEDAQKRVEKLDPKTSRGTAFKTQHEVRMLQMGLRHLQESAQADLEAYSEFWQSALSQQIATAIDEVALGKKLAMVVTGPNAQTPYIAPELDISAEVTAVFDRNYRDEF